MAMREAFKRGRTAAFLLFVALLSTRSVGELVDKVYSVSEGGSFGVSYDTAGGKWTGNSSTPGSSCTLLVIGFEKGADVSDLVIPERVDFDLLSVGHWWGPFVGYPERIQYGAFSGRKNLRSAVIPSFIKPNSSSSTGDGYVFSGCTGLESVKLGCGFVGTGWFKGCTSLRTVDLSIVSSLGTYAFEKSGLTRVTLHSGLPSTVRNSCRFARCADLAEVVLEEGLTGIGGYEFKECTSLKEITIPRSMSYIGTGAFMGCTSLESATILGCERSTNHDGIFAKCKNLKTVTIGDGVTHLNSYMFQYCYGLESVTIGSGVTELPVFLFSYCTSLKKVVFNGNAPSVSNYAFEKVPADCTFYVHRGSTGWGVDIPGTWRGGRSIRYIEGDPTPPAPTPTPTPTPPSVTSYTVSFNANGGKTSVTRRSVRNNAAVGSLPMATRKGYKFKGWYTKKKGGARIKATTRVTRNVTYYARWTANKYKIKFNANGGRGKMKTISTRYGKTVRLKANAFKRSGFKFAGWAVKRSGRPVFKNKAKVKNLTARNGKVVTLYAAWK